MAKYATGTASNTDDFFTKVETHILANGWSLLYSFANSVDNRDRVYIGGAIDSTGWAKPIVRFTYIAATQANAFHARVYTDFDSTAGAGFNQAGGTPGIDSTYMGLQASSFSYWIRANKWAIAMTANPVSAGNNPQNLYAGFLRRNLAKSISGITRSTGAISSGATTVNVDSNMVGRLYDGQKVLLINHAGNNSSANKSRATVKTIATGGVASGSLTFTTTVGAAFDAGTIIGEKPLPAVVVNFYGGTPLQGSGGIYCPLFIDGTRSSNTGQTASAEDRWKDGNPSNDTPGAQNRFRWGEIGVTDGTTNKAGERGLFHHYHACTPRIVSAAYAFTNLTDITDDKTDTFLVVAGDTQHATTLGPR